MNANEIREAVRDNYGAIAERGEAGACCGPSCCGGASTAPDAIGYSPDEEAAAPAGSNLGLGCGNPQAIAALQPGERVLDLGSGAGFDVFLAARAVGSQGAVIGVDMTPAMLARARTNAGRAGFSNVEFRLGEIEHLPVADASIDVVISNCVINLSPDKPQVFREAFRVLSPGGRLAVADVVATAEIPDEIRRSLEAYTGCVAGASPVSELVAMMTTAGFEDITVDIAPGGHDLVDSWMPADRPGRYVASARIQGTKPA